MNISKNIEINIDDVKNEILDRQGRSWNREVISENYTYNSLNNLFKIINSGIPKEDFMYVGDLYRIHSPYTSLYSCVDKEKEIVIGNICCDGSCHILRNTFYTNKVVSYSKCYDFTRDVFYHICPSQQSIIIHSNTKDLYGIDINVLLKRFNIFNDKFVEEQEVLFPLLKDYVVKEYKCTPNQLNFYMKKNKL